MVTFDPFFYIFGIISVVLLLMVVFILRKSTNMSNLLFILTPLLFTSILIFNMLNYYGQIINNFLLWFPYLLAPLGMLLSSQYILHGSRYYKNKLLLGFVFVYILGGLGFSLYSDPFGFEKLTGIHQGSMHLYLIIPFIGTMYFFLKIAALIPDQKLKIYSLISGLFFVVIGSLLRSMEYISNEQDSTIGMVIIVLGSILALLAFSGVGSSSSEQQ